MAVPFLQLVSLLRPFSAVLWDRSVREGQRMVLQEQDNRARDDDGYGYHSLGFWDAPHTWTVKRKSHGEDGLQLEGHRSAGARAARDRTWRGRAYRII